MAKNSIEEDLLGNLEIDAPLQDCSVIASAYERGVAYEPTEKSVYAPLSRIVQNDKSFSNGIKRVLRGYQNAKDPQRSGRTGHKFGNQFVSVPDSNNGSDIAKALKDCIPCNQRLVMAFDLNLKFDITEILEKDVKSRLRELNNLIDLIENVDVYGDFCHLVSLLNFMCIPDLQRMLAILMAYMGQLSGNIVQINNIFLSLLMALFAPVLATLSSLLDQFIQLVMSPLNCIISSISLQASKIDVEAVIANSNSSLSGQPTEVQKFQTQTRLGLRELHNALQLGAATVEQKLFTYIEQLGKMTGRNSATIQQLVTVSNRKLVLARLIALVKAMIEAKSKGFACKGPKPSVAELDTFFGAYVSPTSPFNLSIDDDGSLRIRRRTVKPVDDINNVDTGTNVPSKKAAQVEESTAPTPIQSTGEKDVVIKCNFNTKPEDINRVNAWIEDLDRIS